MGRGSPCAHITNPPPRSKSHLCRMEDLTDAYRCATNALNGYFLTQDEHYTWMKECYDKVVSEDLG